MLITIFFMLASIVLAVVLPIYLKKKNSFYSLRPQGVKTTLKKQRKTIRNVWGIDEIRDGILTIKGYHSIIIELGSIEYRLLNEEEQNNIDSNLVKIAKTFTNQTQFFSTIEKIDTSDKASEIRRNLDKQKNNNIKEYGESIIEYLEDLMQEENLYVRKNYFIITSNEPFDKAKIELEEYYNEFRFSLSNIRVNTRKLDDMDIIELIDREFNKNPNEKIRYIMKKGGLELYVKSKNKEEKREENIIKQITKEKYVQKRT